MKFAGFFVACLLTLTLTACEQKKAAPAAAQPAAATEAKAAEAKTAEAKPGEAKAEEKKEEHAEAPDTHGMPGMGDLFKGKDGK